MTDRGAARTDSISVPRPVIRGESINPHTIRRSDNHRNVISLIDFLAFTIQADDHNRDEFPLRHALVDIFNIPALSWTRTKSGWQGYTDKVKLDFYGIVAFGGTSQKNTIHVELSGKGCAKVLDWLLVYDWFVTTDSYITRIDLAHDDFLGKTVNIDNARSWYDLGLFNSNGRPPKRHMHDDFNDGDGKTFYVGKRGNNKYTRIYEKGKQLGDPLSDWCRVEVEFKRNDRIIPLDILHSADKYLAGAYDALSFLCEEQSKIKSIEKERLSSLTRSILYARTTCGPLINLLCLLNDEDPATVIEALRRNGIPKSLKPYYPQFSQS
ncbi:replication initiation factor domain-containing protein [Gammaproteobacteria bacterium]|nr:replication initiation factor domain-containing protein [Gammaproteobacteria bacterium]